MPRPMPHSMLQHLWGGGWGGRRGGGWRAESGAGEVEDDVVLVAGDDTDKVHPQGVQRAGILCHVKLVGNLLNAQGAWDKNICRSKVFDIKDKEGEEGPAPVCSTSGWGWKQSPGPWEKAGHSGRRPDCYLTSPQSQHPAEWEREGVHMKKKGKRRMWKRKPYIMLYKCYIQDINTFQLLFCTCVITSLKTSSFEWNKLHPILSTLWYRPAISALMAHTSAAMSSTKRSGKRWRLRTSTFEVRNKWWDILLVWRTIQVSKMKRKEQWDLKTIMFKMCMCR